MSLDGYMYHFLAEELNDQLQNGRIQKIYQLGKTDFLWMVRSANQTHQLLLSLSTSLARTQITKIQSEKPDNPSGFCMFQRKYLEGGFIQSVSSIDYDRIIKFVVNNVNEIGDNATYHVYMEVFSRYTNLVITDEFDVIIDAFKHLSPLDNVDRTIIKGATYLAPLNQKIKPYEKEKIDQFFESHDEITYKDLLQNFSGFSPASTKYILSYAEKEHLSIKDSYKHFVNQKINPTSLVDKYYVYDIFDGDLKIHHTSISEMMDRVYLETSKIERMKQISKNVYQLAKREFEKNKNKLEKLTKELDEALASDIYKTKGNLIQQHLLEIKKGDASFSGFDYVTNQEMLVELDRLLTPVQNANLYYKKYKKGKSAVKFIEDQIELTKKQIIYFDVMITQIENGTPSDIEEIKDELIEKGLMRRHAKKSKSKVPNYDIYLTQKDIQILVGKNNLQNEYLTHKLASSTDWWFHTKDIHGSHVIVKSQDSLDEETIRMASMLASYFSKARLSSSVPVDYTQVKYVKKIPGEMGSLVTYTNQKTIYIDPDINKIQQFRKKNH
ncbi:MAG: NFACT family protein [Candidatus Izemoplasmatales bacterium]